MRRVEEAKVWRALESATSHLPPLTASGPGHSIEVTQPCVVVGGRNGAGKTRFLQSLSDEMSDEAVFLNLHHLCEQALILLRSRDDFEDMANEFEQLGPDEGRRNDIQRTVGRVYDYIEWYALEVEPGDANVAQQFSWGGDQSLIPYFKVSYRGVEYSAREMGLGEFSIHFLFWILDQYKHVETLTLLLDEPDAYLPPIGASALLVRLMNTCVKRRWRLIVTTHSSEMITEAVEADSFLLLQSGVNGGIIITRSADDRTAADSLLSPPALRHVFFVEDESAYYLARTLLATFDRQLERESTVIWGGGHGYMTKLRDFLPRPPLAKIRYTMLFDGDMRDTIVSSAPRRWPIAFLPTADDPDTLFWSIRNEVSAIARRLSVPELEVSRFIDSREGFDPHDCVNDFGSQYGRERALRCLAEVWIERNREDVALFNEELREILQTI